MSTNFIEELRWRGILNENITPDIQEYLIQNKAIGYIGFDPTADSLHVGSLVPIIILKHFQNYGHKPIALLGGATGMIGDPSGKSEERNLLNEKVLNHNVSMIRKQLARFIDFDLPDKNKAMVVNNYDWMKDISIIEFARDIGKYISANYMMAKDSVKSRFEKGSQGMSFTEFTYQLFQGYDFVHLFREHNCTVQMGGSDQWGNITTGIELIRKIEGGKAHALTCNLITKSNGSKFGKTEGNNIWLSAEKTSPYKFYQFWINTDDNDAEKYIKIFTFLPKEEIQHIITEHRETPHLRILQKKLAYNVTCFVHSEEETKKAIKASNILFGKSTDEDLKQIDEQLFLDIFEGIPITKIESKTLENSIGIVPLLVDKSNFIKSNSEARRTIKENAISINKRKITEEIEINIKENLINNKYIVLQRGKKNFHIIVII